MKKIISSFIILFVMLSCRDNEVTISTVEEVKTNMKPEDVGRLHNEILDYMNKNLPSGTDLESLTNQEIILFERFCVDKKLKFNIADIKQAITITNQRYASFKNKAARTSGVVDDIKGDLQLLVDKKVVSVKENEIISQILSIIEKADNAGD